MKRVAVVAVLACLLAAPAAPAARGNGVVAPPASWAHAQIVEVVGAGLLADDPAAFRPDDPITAGELYDALVTLGLRAQRPADPAAPLTMRALDARLVGGLGLTPAARRIRLTARDAGLSPPAWLGTETVARLAGLRVNHPFGQDALELGISDLATRAEAAYSLSRIVKGGGAAAFAWVDELAATFAVPALSGWQRAVVARAVQFVGSPYVWAGTSEKRQLQWARDGVSQVEVPGGFDCSGFVWRIYKLRPFAGAPATLAATLKGRTTFEMSAEMPAGRRIGRAGLAPGDLLFFGEPGVRSKPDQVIHAGIYVGDGWFVHSSGAGVTLQPLQGWYERTFAWGRRPLAEAGL